MAFEPQKSKPQWIPNKNLAIVGARGWREEGMGRCCLMGTAFLFCKRKNSGDWLHNRYTSRYLLERTCKTGEDGDFYIMSIGPPFLKKLSLLSKKKIIWSCMWKSIHQTGATFPATRWVMALQGGGEEGSREASRYPSCTPQFR